MQEAQETWARALGREDPQRKKGQHEPAFLPGKSYGQGARQATVHGVTKSRTQLNTYTYEKNKEEMNRT